MSSLKPKRALSPTGETGKGANREAKEEARRRIASAMRSTNASVGADEEKKKKECVRGAGTLTAEASRPKGASREPPAWSGSGSPTVGRGGLLGDKIYHYYRTEAPAKRGEKSKGAFGTCEALAFFRRLLQGG